ncbi:hypothetical protein [Paenibacillus cisolokensis]|nr:hypothetical protein [Paenibacillus cisolokensis]
MKVTFKGISKRYKGKYALQDFPQNWKTEFMDFWEPMGREKRR